MKPTLLLFDDKQVLYALKAGSESAFDEIYRETSPILYKKILSVVKDQEATKEILQNVFVKIWEEKQRINPDLSFKGLLYKITENEIYNHFRKIAKDKNLIGQLISRVIEYDTEESFLLEQRIRMLEDALDLLPPTRSQVYKLVKLQGKSYEEVGRTMNISQSTISDHIVKANRFLKEHLHRFADDVYVAILLLILS